MGTPRSDEASGPRYEQIAEDLAEQIRAGRLKPGERLPSEAQLEERYSVATGTVRRAIHELRTRDLIETQHGRGSLVKNRPPVKRVSSDRFRRSHRKEGKAAFIAESEQVGVKSDVSVLFVGASKAPNDIAEKLSISPSDQVLKRRRLYFRDEIAVEEATSYVPWNVAKDIPELFMENPGGGGIYARIEENGYTLAEFTESLQARLATKQERTSLGLSPGAPVVRLVRCAIATDGRVVEVCDTIMAADQFVFDYRIPADD